MKNVLRYLLLLEMDCCHDADEWIGIYFDDEHLRKAYEQVSFELEEKKKKEWWYQGIHVGIWEFCPMTDRDIEEACAEECEIVRQRQKIQRVSPDDLQCFQEKPKD